jgi:hypothetical protein
VTVGDGLCAIALALAAVGMSWAGAWAAVRNAGIRAEAAKRVVEATRRGR